MEDTPFNNDEQSKIYEPTSVVKYRVNGEFFNVYNHYTSLRYVGQGAFGSIARAYDTINQEYVVIKKHNFYLYIVGEAIFLIKSIKLSRFFDHPNIVRLK